MQEKDKIDIVCLVGFITSIFFNVIGLIVSIIGYNRVKSDGKSTSRSFAIAGIIIAIVEMLIIIAVFIIFVIVALSILQ